MDNRPIGVFDSGLGGLTAVRELQTLLPHENILYFGDTGRVPYGTRSPRTLHKYIEQDVHFLLAKNVKMIIAACGTASSLMPQELIESMGVPYTGVVEPAADYAVKSTKTGHIGVIATNATIASGSFTKAIARRSDCTVLGNACPLFIPLVENGYSDPDNLITRLVAQEYLKPFLEHPEIDTLILGCTHFPVISPILHAILGDQVRLINTGEQAAHYAKRLLEQNQCAADSSLVGQCRYYISDNAENFAENAQLILRQKIVECVEKIEIEQY